MIKMCRDGKDPAKKLLDKSISEFQTTMRNTKDERSLAMISDEAAAKAITSLLREQFPETSSAWESCVVQDCLKVLPNFLFDVFCFKHDLLE